MRSLEQKPKQAQQKATTRLHVNRPGDLHEQEAERVASQVIQDGAPRPRIARPTAPGTGSARLDPETAGSGRPLESPVRRKMEERFGHDFSRVRVHADHAAAESARAAGANAYTVGHSIVFGANRFNPSNPRGERLLAHELTHVAQQALAHGGQSEGIHAQRDKTEGQPAPAAETKPKPTNVRDALDQLFDEFNDSIVGDAVFDKIMTRKAWMEQKVAEWDYPDSQAKKDYDKALAEYKAAVEEHRKDKTKKVPEAPKVPKGANKFTTCIATQQELLKEAFERAGLKIKPVGKVAHFDFATDAKKNATAIGPDVWHTASPNMKERPKKNDIIVLAKRGESVDTAEKIVKALTKYTPKEIVEKTKANELAQAAMQAAEDRLEAAKKAVAALEEEAVSKTSAASIKATGALAAATIAVKAARAKAEAAVKALEQKKNAVSEAEKKLDEKRAAADHEKYFTFSHVGFVISIEKNPDGTEAWTTFDGGQTLQNRKPNAPKEGEPKDDPRVSKEAINPLLQGAKKSTRTYRPKTNEIAGEASQGGDPRWLQGWIDVDKLVQGPAKP